jgi:hypothetical protein
LPPTITRLQEKGVTLENSIALVRKTKNALENVLTNTGKLVSSKMKRAFEKNTGYKAMCHISRVLMGEEFSINEIKEELTSSDLAYFKYAPIASVDVKSNFSKYKNVLDN